MEQETQGAMHSYVRRSSIAAAALAGLLWCCPSFAAVPLPAEHAEIGAGVSQLPRGTWIGPQPPPGWSDIVFVSTPRVVHGDVQSLSSTVLRYAEMLHLVVLADVEKVTPEDGQTPRHRLRRVGFGLAVAAGGALQVVTGPRDSELPQPELGILDSQVVAGAAESLEEMRVLARRTTLALIDSPAVFHQGGENRHRILRMLIWVDPASGRLGQLLWLLREQSDDQLRMALNHAVYLPTPFHEKRQLTVDDDEFNFFGLPKPKAFALVRLPPGRPIPIEGSLGQVLSRRSYSTEQLREFVDGIMRVLREDVSTP